MIIRHCSGSAFLKRLGAERHHLGRTGGKRYRRIYHLVFTFYQGGKEEEIAAFIVSAPGNRQKIIDCQVYKIEVGQTSLDPLPYSFALSNGIKLGDNLDSVRQLMGEPSHVFDYDQYSEAVYDIDSRNLNIGFFQSKEHAFIYQIDIEVDNLSDMFF